MKRSSRRWKTQTDEMEVAKKEDEERKKKKKNG